MASFAICWFAVPVLAPVFGWLPFSLIHPIKPLLLVPEVSIAGAMLTAP